MPKDISLKLCLLTSLVEKSGEEVEEEVTVSGHKNDCERRQDRRSHISYGCIPQEAAAKKNG
jgi:hypothetical protein